jgi:hypothetical protein
MVVGAGLTSALAWEWNGAAWSNVPTASLPTALSSGLFGISCFSASDCIAVGNEEVTPTEFLTVVEQWNGGSWSVVPSPSP